MCLKCSSSCFYNVECCKDHGNKGKCAYLRSLLCLLSNLKIKPLDCPINKSRKWMPFFVESFHKQRNKNIFLVNRTKGCKHKPDVSARSSKFHSPSGLWWGFCCKDVSTAQGDMLNEGLHRATRTKLKSQLQNEKNKLQNGTQSRKASGTFVKTVLTVIYYYVGHSTQLAWRVSPAPSGDRLPWGGRAS